MKDFLDSEMKKSHRISIRMRGKAFVVMRLVAPEFLNTLHLC